MANVYSWYTHREKQVLWGEHKGENLLDLTNRRSLTKVALRANPCVIFCYTNCFNNGVFFKSNKIKHCYDKNIQKITGGS